MTHLLQTDMNQTVEALSMRVVQLENALCDQQELQEAIEAENTELKKRLKESEQRYKSMYKYLILCRRSKSN